MGSLLAGDSNPLLPLLVVAPISLVFIRAVARREDLFGPTVFFSGYYLLWMGAGFAISFYRRGGGAHPYAAQMAFLILLAYLFWLIGYNFPVFHLRRKQTPPPPPSHFRQEDYNSAMRVCLALIIIGIASNLIFYLSGALSVLMGDALEQSRVSMIFGRGYMYFLSKSVNTVIPIYIGLKWYTGKRLNGLDCLMLVAALALVALPFSRRPLIWFIITLIMLFHFLRRRITYRQALLLAAGFLLLAVAMFQLRSPGRSFAVRFFQEINVHVENVVIYLSNLGWLGGQGFLPFTTNLGMLLPGHQIDFGLWLKNQLGLTFPGGGISVTLITLLMSFWRVEAILK